MLNCPNCLQHRRVLFACFACYRLTRDPFLESPDNFSGPESYFVRAMSTLKTQMLLVLKAELLNSKLIEQIGQIWALNTMPTFYRFRSGLKYSCEPEKLSGRSKNGRQEPMSSCGKGEGESRKSTLSIFLW